MKRVLTFAAIALACSVGAAFAQSSESRNWPKDPVRFVTPFPPGSGAETLLRLIADRLAQDWKVATVVENKPGGNTIVAATAVTSAEPDGYTFLFTTEDTVTIIQHLGQQLPFSPQKDLVPVTLAATSYLALVARGNAPFNSLAEMIEAAKARPGALAVATLGPASSHHLLSELLERETGVSMLRVPYKGIPAATLGTVSGEVDMTWANAFAIREAVAAGKLKVLAVTGPDRNPSFPHAPTFEQAGFPKISLPTYFGVFAKAGTPVAVIERFNADLQRILNDASFRRDGIERRGFVPGGAALGAFGSLLREEESRRSPLMTAKKR